MDEGQFVYRSSFLWTFRVMFVWLLVLTIGTGIFSCTTKRGFHLDLHLVVNHILVPFVYSFLVSLVSVFAMTAYFTITITAEGIRGYNAWGKYRFVTWQKMRGAKPFNVLGLKYVRVFTDDGKAPLYVPRFLALKADFKGIVARLAPENNPLRTYFATHNR